MEDMSITELREEQEIPIKEPKTGKLNTDSTRNLLLVMISILLAAVLVFTVIQFINTLEQNKIQEARAATYLLRVEKAETLLDNQQELIFGLMDDYEEAVYNDPQVDNIYQQTFRSNEYQLIALQIIAIQNTQIIELLATMP